jgi:hypothetical protein
MFKQNLPKAEITVNSRWVRSYILDVNRGTGFSITKMTFYTEKITLFHVKIVEVVGL